ncbi:hypothetical protein DENIS_4622 [Desulfonema ishimotonii]|uniref:ABC1 atypical kinase-like domain-containing protein n=1 Tax=Desulfonema ishimotonii TaxID=45657 RepID=A0A401G325_9BACT|nr:AarF/UbiB family protein [Desulfonema ishimotonii]GBC63624.1 hypothetical protein DENIS_4622 [Desulfonema ishimotonii]
MISDMDTEGARALLKRFGKTLNRRELADRICSYADMMGADIFTQRAADELIRLTRPADVVPDIYREYRPVVRDGIRLLFGGLSPERLSLLMADQVKMAEDAPVAHRLTELARQLPTLHKLGQIIARNRHIDPGLRSWLTGLENGIHRTDAGEIRETVRRELGNYMAPFSIRIDDAILSEASVGAVIGFNCTDPASGRASRGVFKVLRPGVREKLQEEFALLEKIAGFFDRHRSRYALKNFRFIETFRDIREALADEINLTGEQAHLSRAAGLCKKGKPVRVPVLLTRFCTENVTAMSLADGDKITEVAMSPAERKRCAQALFDAIIWQPLFSTDAATFFHGDPHAGNIYGVRNRRGQTEPVLLDWSLAGTLSRTERLHMTRLMLGILLEDGLLICEAVRALAGDVSVSEGQVRAASREIMARPAWRERRLMSRAFYFIDQLALSGIRFPRDLLLFRKSFFTLEGVLHELDPDFSMDACVFKRLEGLFAEELPRRWIGFMVPRLDRPEYYKSLVSNTDLQWLFFRLLLAFARKGTGLLTESTSLLIRQAPGGLCPHPVCTA